MIADTLVGPEHRYFKLRSDNGAVYLLRHDERTDRWEARNTTGSFVLVP